MAAGRIYRAGLLENPSGRIYRAGVAGSAPAVVPKGRIYRAGVNGDAVVVQAGRIYRAGVTGLAAVIINPIADQVVEPETLVTLEALLQDGDTADTYTWRLVSSTVPVAVPLGTPTPNVCTFRAPSALPPGVTLLIGVVATLGGRASPERLVAVTCRPQTRWYLHAPGTWRGRRPVTWL